MAASSSNDLEVNEYHEKIIRHYVAFSRDQKMVGLRSFRAAADDFKMQRLSDEAMMTVNEVNDFLQEFVDMLEKEFEQELTHQYRVNALLMKQLFQQAEQWFLKLQPNFDQLENRRLIDLIRDYEHQQFNTKHPRGEKEISQYLFLFFFFHLHRSFRQYDGSNQRHKIDGSTQDRNSKAAAIKWPVEASVTPIRTGRRSSQSAVGRTHTQQQSERIIV